MAVGGPSDVPWQTANSFVSGLRLVPLRCGNCEGRLTASTGATVLLCAECGAGFEVMEDGGLAPVPVSFARYDKDSDRFYPFWVFDARLRLGGRDSDRPSAGQGGLAARFRERDSLRFYCAAFVADVRERWAWSLRLTLEQPELQAAQRQKSLEGFVFSQAEARLFASDLFVTSELRLPDTVRALAFELDLLEPRVIAIALQR